MTPLNDTGTRMHADTSLFPVGTYKLLAVSIGTIGVLGFCNNLLVLVLYYKFKRLRTPTNLLLVNISVSDLLVSVLGTSFTLVSCLERRWVWDNATCVWDGFCNSLFGIVSIMTLCALAYERYIRVVHAQVIDFPWAWRAITHIWLYSLAWTGTPLLGWNRYTLEIHQLGCSLDWASKDPNDASFIIFFLLACFFVPVGIMAYCYGNILYTVHMLRSIEDLQTVQIIKVLRYEKKLAAMFLMMIFCYLMCWTPYAVVSMLVAFGKRNAISPTVAIIPSFFAKSSTAYNPIIYGFMSRKTAGLSFLSTNAVFTGRLPNDVGCELGENKRFWSELDEVMESIPTGERVVIGADFNGHVGEGNRGDEEVMGKFGVKERNLEGQMVVDFGSSERMPEEWRRSVLVPIFKNKGDVQSCSNYRVIKLMSHTMKLWERVLEARLRKVVDICEQQYGFMPRKSTTDAIFALRILMEKYRDGLRELHCVFVDLEKAYDRVPREELWYCMRKSGVAEKYVRVVQDMYERSRTVVKCAVGQKEEFKVEVGLHQGLALSPFLFAMVMDQLSEEVRQESPWTMMFADDIVICSESREQVEENLERWRFALERRGMKASRSKTEYMCVNEREGSGTVRLQGEEVKKVQEFKYLGSTVQSNGECGKEVKKRVQAGWNGWRKMSGVLCDQGEESRIKGKVYRTGVRPAMLYGLETVSLRKRQESELEVAELKILRFSLGVTRLDRIRNEYIRGTANVGRLGDKVREARLRWFGHVQRRDSEYIGRRMLDMELPGRRQRGRPKRRYMDGINEDMKLVGASVEDAEDRDRWREMIRCGDP
ncbi:hypothetical protein QTP70_019102 [Hemibagrus guttatus]|uniref:Opsin-3 n=1 Tax=Hemibagrus guttatus TaxID=175788 RepID=A0AAE0RH03_9TELE|nr:hypothetical protein QTP70_019102 [Hemibagrus guttatus]